MGGRNTFLPEAFFTQTYPNQHIPKKTHQTEMTPSPRHSFSNSPTQPELSQITSQEPTPFNSLEHQPKSYLVLDPSISHVLE